MSNKKKIKFKDLSEEDKEYIALVYSDETLCHKEKMIKLNSKFGIAGRTIRDWWVKLDLAKPASRLPKQLIEARDRSINPDSTLLFVTAAQNKTNINAGQLKNMKAYAKFLEKEFGEKQQTVVIPIRYRNPTSPTEDSKKSADQWWIPEIQPLLFYNKIEFGDTIISADSHVTPTAKMPLTGFEAIAGDNHLILGSPRIHFKTQPRFKGERLRTMLTTGAITARNYSRSRAGDNGFVHHSYGFAIIELKEDGTCYPPRNIYVTDDGDFIDLTYSVKDGEVTKINEVEALVWGDIHREILDKKIYKKTQKLCKALEPKTHVLHDVLDGSRFNPHERKDTFILRQKIVEGKFLIRKEVDQAVEFPSQVLKKCGGNEVVLVESNHDVFLDRHITDMNWKNDLHNSDAYLEYALIQQTANLKKHGNIFGYLLKKRYKNENENVKYLKYGSHLKIKGFNLANHGDFGVNGSRGNITQFKRLNFKLIHGHNHSPIIMDGVTSVGITATVEQYYTRKGMSTHANAHCIIHKNGKRQLVVFDNDGEFTNFI